MKREQLTLRNLDPRVEREIRRVARRERISLNKAAARLLEKGVGIAKRSEDCIGASLDRFIGTWNEKEAAEFLESIAGCEQVDAEFWQ